MAGAQQGWRAGVSSSGGGGVESVTGLNTDNTDPLNPIVGVSVDGNSITGLGTPESPLVASVGGVVFNVVSVNTNHLASNLTTIWATAGASGITIDLPPASSNAYINIIKIDSNIGFVNVVADGVQLINGEPNFELKLQYESISLSSDGTQWIIY